LDSSFSILPSYTRTQILEGHTERESYTSPLPYTYLDAANDLPERFSWADINGTSWM
jgi:hypothetical protein